MFFFGLNINAEQEKSIVNKYLKLGSFSENLPAFSNEKDSNSDLKNLLTESFALNELWPAENDPFILNNSNTLFWNTISAAEGKIILSKKADDDVAVNYLAFYISADRWMTADLKIKSPQMFSVFYDGKEINKKDSYETANSEGELFPGLITSKLKIENGKHIVVLKTLSSAEMDKEWYVESWLEAAEEFAGSLTISTDPEYNVNFRELLDHIKVTDVSVSYDGNIAAIMLSKRDIEEDTQESWIELFDTEDGSLIQKLRGGMSVTSPLWAPKGNSFAYQTTGTKGSSIWIYDFSAGENFELLSNEEDLSGYYWLPDAGSLIYSTTKRPEESDKNFKKFTRIEDRWPYGRDITTLHQVFLPNGMKRTLTNKDVNSSFGAISPDGSELIFSTSVSDPTEWPFDKTTYHKMKLKNLSSDTLFTMIFAGGIEYSPNGKYLLVQGSPQSFDGIGKNVPVGVWPNDYDAQAFIYNLGSKQVTPITKNFDPAVGSMHWAAKSNSIYFNTTDKSFDHLYRYDVNSKTMTYVDLGVEYLTTISFSQDGSKAVFIGESSNIPRKVFTLDLATESVSLLLDPDYNSFKNIKLGDVEDFTFTSSAGQEIIGRINFPPNFDSGKKYPVIVNYYGGTSPVSRNFEGRYPANIWAANGYVVYTLQPSGATGFGQEFSAKHVNDWGKITAQEIIEGTKAFLEEKEYADPTRVGCIGASYGGFMTMNLLTKTDIFTAGISHAGISTLTSYWGEGYWGHSYSAVATANSYPWNRKDIYVDYSPIYNADKINTPLLLLYGNIDPNVPKGESWSMYSALKILGKDVELIEIDQIGHWVMEYHKRNKWSRTVIAYFDKYLKGQPEWWNELYK